MMIETTISIFNRAWVVKFGSWRAELVEGSNSDDEPFTDRRSTLVELASDTHRIGFQPNPDWDEDEDDDDF